MDDVQASFEMSLKALDMDYVDLVSTSWNMFPVS